MLIHRPTQKVVLNLRDPDRVTTVIPTAKKFRYKGVDLVAVPHRLDETRVLRNLGFDVPSPVKEHYKWSGSYSPFFAQRETAEFLTMNPRAYCLNDMGCVDAGTEYLSPTGWRYISEYQGGPVAQYHPDTGAAEFVEPTEYVKKPCHEMIRLKTKYGLDQLLSPEHRMLVQSRANPAKREVVQAEEMLRRHEVQHMAGTCEGRSLTTVAFSQAAIPVTFSLAGGSGVALTDAQLRVQIAVIADGHFPNGSSTCTMRVKKPRKVARLEELLREAHIAYSLTLAGEGRTDEGFTIFSFEAPLRLKVFDERFWAATQEQREIIADEVLRWDGTDCDGRREFFSTSKASADFVQFVFASLSQTARIVEDRRNYTTGGPCYTAIIRDNGQPLMLKAVTSDGEPIQTMWREPSPDGFKYCFMVPSTFLLFRRNGCIFASGNTGKTLAALWSFDYLRSVGKAKKLLVVAPLSTLERTWGDEIFTHFPHLNFVVLHGSKQRRQRLLAQDADIYLVNHDGIKVLQDELVARKDIDAVVVDELATFRNVNARWRSLNAVVQGRTWVWGLTGTPTPNEPTDAWAQIRLITPENVTKYKGAFRDKVMKQVTQFKWAPRPDATDIVHDAMQPSIRFKREDCVDLPPCMWVDRHVSLTQEQQVAFREMQNKLMAEIDGGQVLAMNEAVKLSKLVQISCGVVYGLDGQERVVPAKDRIEVVAEVIEQAPGKVIVFVPFTSVLGWVSEQLAAAGFNVATISGATPKAQRDEIFGEFQKGKSLRVIVAQPATMSHGLTLTAANTVVWYAPITSNEVYQQANARVTRPGQKLSQLIVNVYGTEVERRIYNRLKDKQEIQGCLLDLVRGSSPVETR